MTSKEALELLYSDAENYAYFNETEEDLSEIKAEYELIKQDLDRLEKLEKDIEIIKNENCDYQIENAELKNAIEILKGKICLHNGYVCYDAYADIKLTKDECELLKGVLEND